MQVFVRLPIASHPLVTFDSDLHEHVDQFKTRVAQQFRLPLHALVFRCHSRLLSCASSVSSTTLQDFAIGAGDCVQVDLRLVGGMDFQNRVGSKPGSGGVASESQANIDRRERLRKLALETVDLSKDPYFMKNHLGSYECKLCLTLHNNEGNYLAHTQGKRHQTNLARRAAKEASDAAFSSGAATIMAQKAAAAAAAAANRPRALKIGLPGYKVTKQKDPDTGARILLFQILYPDHDEKFQPRHRFMSAFEQKIETPPDKRFQFLLFACEPYETIAFKIPNVDIDKREGKFFSNWDKHGKTFTLQLHFKTTSTSSSMSSSGVDQEPPKPAPPPPRPTLRYM